ncbi:xanthine dehydrogenase family protein molybdopterin-binding subunit [Natranaerofaba carboxydovora]|uniref:xanthine dehydrogenase family protein molybdopterin-binding subunit n=1 Tax=Natranaerofaba carboxydovora TaxID=2742683 RepID=UPI001F1454FE|nr:molybdopterin cofactor-binding domain-containing protein [Natranaerofaba carboxydovora]UMZ74786.1 4-hydroxybenzoyl-CoA reductase subunit alpha [Natranaerofaba carboxydovora]
MTEDTKKDYNIIGKSLPQYDAAEKAMGKAKYVDDINLGKVYHGKILRSTVAHAKIKSIDVEEAQKVPGVKGIFTGKDVPDNKFGPMVKDWEILAKDRVRFIGDEVAVVIAIDEETADTALEKIKVDYEELPAVFDPEEAFEEDAPAIHEEQERNVTSTFEVERGDVDGAYEEADYIYEDVFYAGTLYHAHLETQRGIAVPEVDNRITLYLSIQVPSMARLRYAEALNMDPDDIRIVKPHVGGGFGAKFEYKSHIIAAFAARELGIPVKIINTREEDFIASNPRVPMRIYLKVAFNKDGKITAKETKLFAGNGARTVYAPAIMKTACYRLDSMYKLENVRTKGYSVYTNTVPTSCYRGFGNSQMHFAFEQAMDVAAEELDIGPDQIRLINAIESGETSVHGWKVNTCGLPECVDTVVKESDFNRKREEYKNQPEGTKKRGIGLAVCNHVSGNRPFYPPFEGSSAILKISPGGKVKIHTGEAEIGQGMNTTFAQIAAEVLGLPLKDVKTEIIDTDVGPFGCGTFASRATTLGGNAVLDGAKKAKEIILDYASKCTEVPAAVMDIKDGKIIDKNNSKEIISFAEVCEKAFFERGAVPITVKGTYIPDTVMPDEANYGNVSPAYPFGCHIVEVEVDTETGKVALLNYWAAHDVGTALNPLSLEGQIEGGVANAMGWTLSEKMRMSDGEILNPNLLDYKVPTSADVNYNINTYLIETNEPNGPFGAKGIGEPAKNPGAPAIANAIYNATGLRLKEIPFMPEQLYFELKNNDKK